MKRGGCAEKRTFFFMYKEGGLSVFEWAKSRKHKGGIKLHTLYAVEAEVLARTYLPMFTIQR